MFFTILTFLNLVFKDEINLRSTQNGKNMNEIQKCKNLKLFKTVLNSIADDK